MALDWQATQICDSIFLVRELFGLLFCDGHGKISIVAHIQQMLQGSTQKEETGWCTVDGTRVKEDAVGVL